MAREPKYGATINSWERLLERLESNLDDFPYLEIPRAELALKLGLVREVSAEQAARMAEKQDATKRLQALIVDGRKLATFLRSGVRQRYGDGSEKLVEFDLKPFRGRTRPAADAPPAEPAE